MEKFHGVVGDLMVASGRGIEDRVDTIGGIVSEYRGGNNIETSDGMVGFSGTAAQQLYGLLELDPRIMNKFDGHPELQMAMLQAKLQDSGRGEDVLVARGIEREDEGTLYQAFLTNDHLPVLNTQVLGALRETLPTTTEVNRASVANRKMSLRIVDPNWYHDLGSGGRALTAIVIENDERGGGGLSIRTGITRVACWNYTLNQHRVFEHTSGFIEHSALAQGIKTAVDNLHGVAEAVAVRMLAFQEVTVDDVRQMLRIMSGEMALPAYASEAAETWWQDNGSHNSLFWVVQALAFAAGSMTQGRRRNWQGREQVECQSYHMADSYAETGEIHYHECPRCHRPMSEYGPAAEATIDGEFEIGE